ncbi:MAG: RNA degradosome polyphosphate kinase, partial [Rhodospirillaceae bacterium]|nr:RNA degradosome polyphosphate kinase [Rhodospirillaceae bacterium]
MRVLEEAENVSHPLLERVRFLSISASNLDEFYMVRVAGLKGQVRAGVTQRSADGLTPQEQLTQINTAVRDVLRHQDACWGRLQTELDREEIHVVSKDDLNATDKAWLQDRFMEHIFPVLTPLAIDPAHPFPFIPNLGLSLILQLVRIENGEGMRALVPMPSQVDRLIRIRGRK